MLNAWVAKKQSHKVAVVAGVRTPFAKAGTKLKDCSAVHLGIAAVREAIGRDVHDADDERSAADFENAIADLPGKHVT